MTAAASPADTLPRRRKAAMIVQLLLDSGDSLSLAGLPEPTQEALAAELGSLRLVDRDTVSAVAGEFADLLEAVGLSAPGDRRAALAALSGRISPALAARLEAQAMGSGASDPWDRIAALAVPDLCALLSAESQEVGAIVLSKLPVATAAEALEGLPGDLARRISLAVGRTEGVAPDTVARIGAALAEQHCQSRALAFDRAPPDRLGAMLNAAPAATRDRMLADLDGSDADFARTVRKAIFTFEDIPARVADADVPACLRGVDPADLATAIAHAGAVGGAAQAAADFLLGAISQRMAGQIREEVEERGTPATATGEKAMTAVTTAIRALADAGDITLRDPGPDG